MAKFKSKDLLLKTNQKAYFGTSNESYISWDGSDLVLSGSDVRVKNDLVVEGLTASLLVATDATDKLVSVSDLTTWIGGTSGEITVTDDTDGTVTLSLADPLLLNDLVLSGDLTVSGTSTLIDDVYAQKNVFIDDNLNVGGNTILSGTLEVVGVTTLDNNLNVGGTTTLSGNMYYGANTISGTGDIHATNIYATNEYITNIEIIDTQYITNDLYVADTATFSGTSEFQDDVVMWKDLTVGGNTILSGTLNVSGTATFGGEVNLPLLTPTRLVQTDASGNLESVADLTNWIAGTDDQITVDDDGDGTVTLRLGDASGNVAISGTLSVTGTSVFNGDVYLNNNTYFGGNVISGTGDIYAGNFYGTFSGTQVSGTIDHSTLTNLDYDSANHTGFVSIGTTQTITGAKTFTQTITTNNSQALLPTTSGAEDIGSVTLPYDEFFGKSFKAVASGTEGGTLILGNSGGTTASYAEIYDGGTGKPGYIILHAGDGTAYYATVTDNGGFYIDTSTPSGAGVANIEFGASAITIQDNVIVDGLTADRLVSTNASKQLTSVSDLTSWIAGTANEITVTDDTDGTVTIGIADPLVLNDLTIGGDLTVSGTSTLIGDVTAGGNVLIDDNLSVGGNTILSGTLEVIGVTTLDNNLNVGGTTTLSGNMYYGANTISGTGDIHCTNIYATNEYITNIEIIDTQYITNDLYVADTATFSGTSEFQDDVVMWKDLTVGGNTILSGTLNVSGTATFGGEVNLPLLTPSRLVQTDASGNLESVADLTNWIAGTDDQITVDDDGDGTVTLRLGDASGNVAISGTLGVSGTSTFNGDVYLNNNTYFGSNIISGTGDIYCGKIYGDIEDTNRRSGRVDCINGSNTVTGTFASAYGDTNYTIVVSLEKDAGTPSEYAMTITNQTNTGFVVEFSGDIDAADYDLHYIAVHD